MPLAPLRDTTEDRGYLVREDVATPPPSRVKYEPNPVINSTAKAVGWLLEFVNTKIRSYVAERQWPTLQNPTWRFAEEVEKMKDLSPDWNGYGSQPPFSVARETAKSILLDASRIVLPRRVAPSAEGGVGIEFFHNGRYADIECFNSGEILATISDRTGNPDVWVVNPAETRGALERISEYIGSRVSY